MKPYGREKKVRFPHKTDCHPPKGYINWWETMADFLSRSRMKQILKRNINKEDEYFTSKIIKTHLLIEFIDNNRKQGTMDTSSYKGELIEKALIKEQFEKIENYINNKRFKV